MERSARSATSLVDEAIAPSVAALKAVGFRGSGRTFYRVSGETSVLYSVHSSRWNTSPFAAFTINLGTYIPALAKRLGKEVLAAPPRSLSGCVWSSEISPYIEPGRYSYWWEISKDHTPSRVGEHLLTVTKDFAIPWLERSDTVDGFCESVVLQASPAGAELLWKLGRRVQAHLCAERALKAASSKESARYARLWLRNHPVRSVQRVNRAR